MSVVAKKPKYSRRTPKITQRLAEYKKQEKTFDSKVSEEETDEDDNFDDLMNEVSDETSDYNDEDYQAPKILSKNAVTQPEHKPVISNNFWYGIKQVLEMDLQSLFKLFVRKEVKSNQFLYSCYLVGGYCRYVLSTPHADKGEETMLKHLKLHMELLKKKSVECSTYYNRRKFFIADVRKENDSKLNGEKDISIPHDIRINPPDLESSDFLPLSPKTHAKDDLLSAISLRRASDIVDKQTSSRINTRLNRRKAVEYKNNLKKKKMETNLIKHFKNQPKVVMETIKLPKLSQVKKEPTESFPFVEKRTVQKHWIRKRKPRVSAKKIKMPVSKKRAISPKVVKNIEIKEELFSNDEDEGSTSPGSDSSDENESRSENLLSEMAWMKKLLPQAEAKTQQCKPQKYIPTILRRTRPQQIPTGLSNIKIVNCISLADKSNECPQGSPEKVSPAKSFSISSESLDPTNAPNTDTGLYNSDNETSDDTQSEGDIRSDSSEEESEEEVLEKDNKEKEAKEVEKLPPIVDSKRLPRKQSLKMKSEIVKPNFGKSMIGIQNDHDYTEFPTTWVVSDNILEVETQDVDSSEWRRQKRLTFKVKSNIEVVQSKEYELLGPSSKKIPPATSPAMKAKALQLLSELRHTRPKEIMVCTERVLNNGQSSFIVQDFYSCELCGKKFSAPNSLYGHYRGHAGIKPYKCQVCGKTFTRSHSLTYHSMIHENKARFECEYCDRKFRHPTHYKEHLNRHTGQMPYRCTDCPRRFRTRNTFRRHVVSKHDRKVTSMASRLFPGTATIVRQTAVETSDSKSVK
nr:transcriptional regulator Kaiso isoform X1 [Ciona intestinalis]|eukprot:XP_002123368.3 transcriptional regulator Kaiso isoform X1 [Ciona intestinalis]